MDTVRNTSPEIVIDEIATIDPRLVSLRDVQPGRDDGLFADFARELAQREASEAIERNNPLAAEMIKRTREAYAWLGLIGRENNVPTTLLPTVAVRMYDMTIPQHPWSTEPDDYSWGAELAVSNPLPGVATVAVEARGKIIATKALQQGEILWLAEYGSSSEQEPEHRDDTIEGIVNAARVLVTALDGTVYAARVPGMEPDGPNSSAVEAFVTLERQARTDR